MTEDLSEPFRIEGDDIDAEAIMQQIRARLRARRVEVKAKGLDFEVYADGLYPLPPDAVLSRDLYEAVRCLELSHGELALEMAITKPPLPLAGGLVQRVRAAFHSLVLFYVNRLAGRQAWINDQTARVLTAMVRGLEVEVRDLRARIAELEANQE